MKRKWAKTVKANPAYTAKQQARTAAMIGLIVSTGATHLILTKPGGESAPVDRSLVQEPMNKVTAKAQVQLAGGNVNLVEPKAKTQVTVPVISKSLTITPPVERQKTVFIPAPSVIKQEQTRQTPDQLAQAASVDPINLSNTPHTKTLPSSVATVIETNHKSTQTQAKLLQVLRVNRLVRQLKQSQAVATNSGFETINQRHIVSPAVTASSGIETETVPVIGEAKSTWTRKQTLLIDRLKQKERLEDSIAQLKFKLSKSNAIINKKKLISSLQNQETHSQTAASLGLLPGVTPTSSNQNNSSPSSPTTVFVIPAITPTNNQVVVPGVVSRVNTGQNKAIALKLGLPLAVTKTNHLDNPNSPPTSVLTSNTEGKNINKLPIAVVPPVNISDLAMGGDISDDDLVSASPPPNVEQIQQAQSAAAQALLSNQYVQWQTDIQKLRQKYPTEGVLITQVPSGNQTDIMPATARTNQKLLRLIPSKSPQPINPEFADSQAAKTLQPNDRKSQHIRVRVRDGLATAPSGTDAASLRSVQEQNVSPALPPLGGVDNYLPKPISVSAQGLIWPARGKLTSGYGWRWGRMHKGVDIAAPIGTPIMAAAPGVVVKAGWSSGGYGNMVDIQHKDGTLTRYAHNKRLLVQAGEVVQQGQQISEMGSTGFSTGPHLHFEVRPMGKKAVNPIAYLPR